MTSEGRSFGRAVVIGGSMAGLMTAKVLSEHFTQVVIIERDTHEGPSPRKGVPQGRHIHVILNGGMKVLDGLFPGMFQQMEQEGAETIDTGRDFAWHHFGVWKQRYVSGIEFVLSTRVFLEWNVFQRVRALPNVSLREGWSVEELVTDGSRQRITGVRVKGPEGEETLEADLVVDASGRGSRLPRWLESLGYPAPEEESVGIDLAYTTRLYERPASYQGDWKLILQYPRSPDTWKAGFISNVEGGRWIVSLNGYFGDHPPTDDAGFLEFARSLPQPYIHEAIRDARPLTEAVTHKVPSTRWLHYERLKRFPERLVVVGDAVAALNPIFGQGMSVASQGVDVLRRCLEEHARRSPGTLDGLAPRFRERLPEVIRLPWFLSSTLDLHYPQAKGKRLPGLGLVQWFVGRLLEATSHDSGVYHQLNQVLHLNAGLGTLLQPGVSLPVLAYGLKSFFVPLEQRANVNTLPPAPGAPSGLDVARDRAA